MKIYKAGRTPLDMDSTLIYTRVLLTRIELFASPDLFSLYFIQLQSHYRKGLRAIKTMHVPLIIF